MTFAEEGQPPLMTKMNDWISYTLHYANYTMHIAFIANLVAYNPRRNKLLGKRI